MKQITLFGKQHLLKEQRSTKDTITLKNNIIIIDSQEKTAKTLLKEFLNQLLYDKLVEISETIKAEGKVELFGDLDFDIVDNIDNKKERIAKLKGNKVIVKLNAVVLPETALKYIVAHELGHTASKRHTNNFWKTVKKMCPNLKREQELLEEFTEPLLTKIE